MKNSRERGRVTNLSNGRLNDDIFRCCINLILDRLLCIAHSKQTHAACVVLFRKHGMYEARSHLLQDFGLTSDEQLLLKRKRHCYYITTGTEHDETTFVASVGSTKKNHSNVFYRDQCEEGMLLTSVSSLVRGISLDSISRMAFCKTRSLSEQKLRRIYSI